MVDGKWEMDDVKTDHSLILRNNCLKIVYYSEAEIFFLTIYIYHHTSSINNLPSYIIHLSS